MLDHRWASVADAGPTSIGWLGRLVFVGNSVSWIGCAQQTRHAVPNLSSCLIIVCDIGPTLTQQWNNVSCLTDTDPGSVYNVSGYTEIKVTLSLYTAIIILPCKAKRQYLLTCKVSRYRLLAVHGSMAPA